MTKKKTTMERRLEKTRCVHAFKPYCVAFGNKKREKDSLVFLCLSSDYSKNSVFTSSSFSIMPDLNMKSAVRWKPALSASVISVEKS